AQSAVAREKTVRGHAATGRHALLRIGGVRGAVLLGYPLTRGQSAPAPPRAARRYRYLAVRRVKSYRWSRSRDATGDCAGDEVVYYLPLTYRDH
ncbi:MAG: hypothetical protein ACK56F_06320, partial [bacterium]